MQRPGGGALPRCAWPNHSAQKAVPIGRAMNSTSADGEREFVDANILVYAFDASAGIKQAAAAKLLERLWNEDNGCLSVQVLQEFFVVVTRKVARPLSID